MSTAAIIMMTVSMVLVWGGMVLSFLHLRRNPDETSGTLADDPQAGGGDL